MIVDFEACANVITQFEETKRKHEDWKRIVRTAAEHFGLSYREITVTSVGVHGFHVKCENGKFYWDDKKLNKLSEVITLMSQRAIRG